MTSDGSPREPRLGLIVNPVAGLGGAVGLKGSDGELAARARVLGARQVAPSRAALLLERLAKMSPRPRLLTCSGEMGEGLAREAGFDPVLVHAPMGTTTSAQDTRRAAISLVERDIDLLLFVGGDGTARDVLAAIGSAIPVLGVPAGVKMHSAVFATGARAAADAVERWWQLGRPLDHGDVVDREPLDNDMTPGPVRLFGSLRIPRVPECLQRMKAGGPAVDQLLEGAIEQVAGLVADSRVSLLGPGSTLLAVKRLLGFEGSVLGVDVVCAGKKLVADAGESQLMQFVEGKPARIVVTVIGGQGFIFGRGNQPLSPRVIRAVGIDNVVIVASAGKLAALPDSRLLVDTGDGELDRSLAGYRPVIIGAKRQAICRVCAADPESGFDS